MSEEESGDIPFKDAPEDQNDANKTGEDDEESEDDEDGEGV